MMRRDSYRLQGGCAVICRGVAQRCAGAGRPSRHRRKTSL